MLILLYALFSSSTAIAASDVFHDAVSAYSSMRISEETLRIEELNPNVEGEKIPSLKNDLTQKRIEFNTMIKSEQKEYLPWQKQIFGKNKSKSLNSEALNYLVKNFPEAKNFSPFQWKTFQELFGDKTQEAFFKISLNAEEIGTGSLKQESKSNIVVVFEPFERIFSGVVPSLTEDEPIVKDLIKNGHFVETIQLSAYPKFDDQADELYRLLTEKKGNPFALVSSNESSAVVLKCLDLHPDLLKSKKITGWINLNGKLYGIAPENKGRSLASTKQQTPMQKIEEEAKLEMNLLFKESLTGATPLGKGFPIINLIQIDNKISNRNLGESVVQGGKTYLLRGNPSASGAIPLLRSPASTAGLKDSPAELF